MSITARHFCHLCKVMFLNGAMWNIRLFSEPVGATIKKSWPLTNPSTTVLWLSVISLKPIPIFTGVNRFVYVHFLCFLYCFTSKPNACQGKVWPGSSFLKIDLTRKSISWLDIPNNTLGCHTAGQKTGRSKYSTLQVRKVHFPTDHLTSRNWKQSLTKYTYWHSNVFRSLQMQCRVFCTFTRIFLASKQVRKSWYSRAKKTTLILYTHAAIQVQAFWRKLKKLRLFRHNKSLMLYQR